MGVLGSGKTTIGKKLAEKLGCEFHDGEDYYSKESRQKIRKGIPLTEGEIKPWIYAIRSVTDMDLAHGGDRVIACSCLKERYRFVIVANRKDIRLIYLKGTQELVTKRIGKCTYPHIGPDYIKSQFETLEEPKDALVIDITKTPDEIVEIIMAEREKGNENKTS
jgi:gluconokinase